jgi:hypothetical protein
MFDLASARCLQRRDSDMPRRDHAQGLRGLRSRAEGVQRRTQPRPPSGALPAEGRRPQAGQQPQGRLRPANTAGVHRPHRPRHHARAPAVTLALLRIVRRSTLGDRPPSSSRNARSKVHVRAVLRCIHSRRERRAFCKEPGNAYTRRDPGERVSPAGTVFRRYATVTERTGFVHRPF